MTARTMAILVGTSLALVAAGAIVLRAGQRSGQAASAGVATLGGPLMPALASNPDRAQRIIVTRGGVRVEVERVETTDAGTSRWVVASKYGYPADERVVRAVLTGAIDAVVVEEKTALASNFARLGIADQSDGGATAARGSISTRLRIEEQGSKPEAGASAQPAVLGDVLIGKPELPAAGAPRSAGATTSPRLFVRRVGEERALLAEASLAPETDWLGWVSTLISRLDEEAIDKVEITHPGSTPLVFERSAESGMLALSGVPEGRTLRDAMAPARIASVVSTLTFEDVAPAATIQMPESDVVTTRFTRRDGLVMTVRTLKVGSDFWISAGAAVSEETTAQNPEAAPAAEARSMNERWKPWAFRVAPFRGEDLTRTLEDLLEPAAAEVPSPPQRPPSGTEPAPQ
jgi:hypothetical protein